MTLLHPRSKVPSCSCQNSWSPGGRSMPWSTPHTACMQRNLLFQEKKSLEIVKNLNPKPHHLKFHIKFWICKVVENKQL